MYAAGSSSSTSSSFLHFVMDDPIISWWADCPCCWKRIQIISDRWKPVVYCYNCWKWWIDWHWEMKWAGTRDCMLMLATRSVQDNPHAAP